MASSLLLSPLTLLAVVASTNAYPYYYDGHHSTTSRIIAGVIVGVVGLICLLLICRIYSRRRARRTGAINWGTGPTTTTGNTGLFSSGNRPGGAFGRWGGLGGFGRKNNVPQPDQYNQGAYNAPQGQYYNADTPYGQNYAQNGGAPPPYIPDGGNATAPSGGYAPPPGPPPQAHMKDESFAGGFRGSDRV